MPGKLYFYVNFGTIKKKGLGRSPYFGKPDLRDLEWEFFLNWTEARGFSSFEKDDKETCLKIVKDLNDFEIIEIPDVIYDDYPEAINSQGKLKKYVEPREYLRRIHSENLGVPSFKNQSQNMMMLGCHPKGTQVRMFDNSVKNIEDIQIGDELLGIDNNPRVVQKLIRGDESKMYKIHQSNGETYEVTNTHELEILDKGKRKKITAEKLFEVQSSICGEHFKNKYKGFKREGVDFIEQEVPLDPYFLGI